jgi:DNA-binding LacI/PurR family transcriptional regulator/anti-anti-sigma regulatory factor
MPSGRHAIGVLTPQASGGYFGMLFEGIHAVTRTYDPRLIVVQGSPTELTQTRIAMDLVDGWIIIGNADGVESLAAAGVPFVTIGAQLPHIKHASVFPDNHGGMRAAVDHLIEHGHRRIAFVGDLQHGDIAQRYAGYQAALAEAGIAHDPALVMSVGDVSERSGASVSQRILEATPRCTAVAVATDEGALGLLSALQAAGHHIPDEIAVVGFDDIILAHSATPALTTVRVPILALGSTAAELLLAQLTPGEVATTLEPTYVPTALIQRRSCGCNMLSDAAPADTALKGEAGWRRVLAAQIAQLARYPLPPDPSVALSDLWPGGERLIDLIDTAIHTTNEISTSSLYDAWNELVILTESIETLISVLGLLEAAGKRQAEELTNSLVARARLEDLFSRSRLEMLRARLRPESEYIRSYAVLVQQNSAISRALVAGAVGDVQQLAWVAHIPMSWATLGLWEGGSPGQRPMLGIAGSYVRSGRDGQPLRQGARIPAAQFPSIEHLPSSVREAGTEIVMLIPVYATTEHKGFLALSGPIEYLRASGNYDALTSVATLVGTTLERDALLRTVHEALERERGLADVVRELGCPVIPLMRDVLLIPLIGTVDAVRAQQMIEAVLEGVSTYQASTVLLDISGVPLVDTQVANAFMQVAQAAGLLGARVTLIGIRPEIAQSIVDLGIDFNRIAIQPTLAAAVRTLLQAGSARLG